jgi:hypothetical protein
MSKCLIPGCHKIWVEAGESIFTARAPYGRGQSREYTLRNHDTACFLKRNYKFGLY